MVSGNFLGSPVVKTSPSHPRLVLCDNLEGGVRREVGEGSGWGDTCIHMADSCLRMEKPPHIKVIILQLK